MTSHLKHLLSLLIVSLIFPACASDAPRDIRKPPPGNPKLSDVRLNAERYLCAKVRWGGVIASIENKASETGLKLSPVIYRAQVDLK